MNNTSIIKKKLIYFFYFFLVFTSLFTNYFHYDEGIINQVVVNFLKNKDFSNVHGVNTSFGKIFYSSLSKLKFTQDINYYFLSRIYSFVSVVCIIFIFIKISKDFLFKTEKILIFPIYILIYWFGFNSGGLTSRPDSIVSFLIFFSFYASLLAFSDNKFVLFYIAYLLSIILINLHPNFLIIALINFMQGLYFLHKRKISFYLWVSISLLSVFILLNLFIYGEITSENINLFIKDTKYFFNISLDTSYKSVNGLEGIIINLKKEFISLDRIFHLKLFYKGHFYLLIFLFLFFFLTLLKKKKNKILNFYIIFVIICLGLLPNKWSHHLSLLIPLLAINLLIFIESNSRIYDKLLQYKVLFLFLFNLFLLANFYFYGKNNYFFYNFLNENTNFVKQNKYFFSKIKKESIVIEEMIEAFKNKTFIADPDVSYIFKNSKYLGYEPKLIDFKKKKVDFIIYNHNSCDESLNYLIIKYKFTFNNKDWVACVK